MANTNDRPTITPEQAGAISIAVVQGALLWGGVGAAGGALLSESGHRVKGAFVGAGIGLGIPIGLGLLVGLAMRNVRIGPAT